MKLLVKVLGAGINTSASVDLYATVNTDLKNLADIIVNLPVYKNANEYMTGLIKKFNFDGIYSYVVGSYQVSSELYHVDKYVEVTVNANGAIGSITVFSVKAGRTAVREFNGWLAAFKEFADPSNKLVELLKTKVNKLLRFRYNGGSKPGEIRIIRLESVTGVGDNAVLKGIDLYHSLDPKAADKGYRTFTVSKIENGVEVLD